MPAELDEATRPRLTRRIALTPEQQAPGMQLRAIHEHFKDKLHTLLERVAEVRRGDASLSDVRAVVNEFTGAQSYETLGSFCRQYCQLVTLHHTIEDQRMFPTIAASPTYRSVVDRLSAEHVVIHAHLVDIDAALVRLEREPAALADLDDAVSRLARDLVSHFAYEEEELSEPLGLLEHPV